MYTYLVLQTLDGIVIPQVLRTDLGTEKIGTSMPGNRHVFLVTDDLNISKWAGKGFAGFNTVQTVGDIKDLF